MKPDIQMAYHAIASYTKVRLTSVVIGLIACTCLASATDLTIRLPDDAEISRQNVNYQCDAKGPSIGVPAGTFSVEYISAGGNNLAVVPISGRALIFSNVMSGSGARYTALEYTWWTAKGGVTLTSDSLSGKIESACRQVEVK